MNAHVPFTSLLCMDFCLVFAFAMPIGLCVWLRKVKGAALPPFFVGAAVMLLFAFGLEGLIGRAIVASPLGAAIQARGWLYAVFGGAMAGLFEESGRFLAFKTVLKKQLGKDENALMYGAGHGGLEAIVLLGITSINNLTYAVLINVGKASLLTQGLPEASAAQVRDVVAALVEYPAPMFLAGAAERLFAMLVQLSLSVLVWFAAKKPGKLWLYPLAILLHLAVDAVSGGLSLAGVPVLLIELGIAVMALLCCLLARCVWKRCAGKEEEEQAAVEAQ